MEYTFHAPFKYFTRRGIVDRRRSVSPLVVEFMASKQADLNRFRTVSKRHNEWLRFLMGFPATRWTPHLDDIERLTAVAHSEIAKINALCCVDHADY